MPKRVYLFELDSVRRTDEEIITAQKTLYDEIVKNGNIVVMTCNQIVDSRGFLSLFSNSEYQKNILALFEKGYLQISQCDDIRTVTQYLINAMEKEFYFSALPIKQSQKHLIALVKRSLIYSDLTELAGYLKGGRRTLEERRMLFKETGGVASVEDHEQETVLKNLYGLLETIQKISIMDAVYIPPRDPKEYEKLHMHDFLRIALDLQMPDDPLWEKAISIIEEIVQDLDKEEDKDSRSVYLQKILSKSEENSKEHSNVDLAPYQYAEVIVDLCVNYAYEASIADVSKHYDTEEFLRDGASSQTFRSDFAARLSQSWSGEREASHRFLQEETNKFVPFEDSSSPPELPDFSLAVRYTGYVPAQDAAESAKRVDGYESGIEKQKKRHRNRLLSAVVDKLLFAIICLILVCCLNMIIDLVQDMCGISLIGAGALFIRILKYFVFLLLAEWFTCKISKWTHENIDSLSKSLGQISLYFEDCRRIRRAKSVTYQNEDMVGKDFSERRNKTVQIDCIVSGAMKKYRKLRSKHSSGMLFAYPTGEAYPLADVSSDDVLKKLTYEEEASGVKFGVVSQSRYNLMLSDPIQDTSGGYFPYERVVPVQERPGAVILTRFGEKFLLIRQFRHALREQQYAFVRGFAKKGETPEECAHRELSEELGEVKIVSSTYLGECAPDSGLTSEHCDIFCVRIESFKGAKGHEGISEYLTLSVSELEEWIANGRINDGFTLAAYAMYCAKNARA